MKKNTAIFLDRDGTINVEVGYLDSEDKLSILPEAYEAVRRINESGPKAIVVTNQAGVAKGLFSEDFVRRIHEEISTRLSQRGASIDGFYYCPHHPTEGREPYRRVCACRKPEPGLLLQAARDFDIDLARSYMIGDRYRDIETAHRVGAKGVLVLTGYGQDLLQEAGPDAANAHNAPDYIAADILAAVNWILKDRM